MQSAAENLAMLKKLWASGHFVGQIGRRLKFSRNAVQAKALGPIARSQAGNSKVMPLPKRRASSMAACIRPVSKVVSSRKPPAPPKELSKREGYAMLAEAVRNTGLN